MSNVPRLDELDQLPTPPTRPRRITLGIALLALLVAFLAAQLLGKLAGDVARSITHADTHALSAGVVVPSLLASELGLLLVSLLVPLTRSLPVRESLGLLPASLPLMAAAGLGTVLLGPLGDQLMTTFSAFFPDLTLGVVPTLHDLAQRLPLSLLWPTFALLPGIAEETLFRGVLLRAARNKWLGVVLSGCAFALFHVDPVHVIGVLPLGLFLSWVGSRSNTSVTIVAHVLNNSVALFAIQNAELDVGFGSEQALPPSWLIVSLAGFCATALAVYRMTPPPSAAASVA
jgi:membrane protease YdiL (CAAX protease family)